MARRDEGACPSASDRGATQPAGMHRRPERAGYSAPTPYRRYGFSSERHDVSAAPLQPMRKVPEGTIIVETLPDARSGEVARSALVVPASPPESRGFPAGARPAALPTSPESVSGSAPHPARAASARHQRESVRNCCFHESSFLVERVKCRMVQVLSRKSLWLELFTASPVQTRWCEGT